MDFVKDLSDFFHDQYNDEVTEAVKNYVDHMEKYLGSVSPRDFRTFLNGLRGGEVVSIEETKPKQSASDFVSTKTIKSEESLKVADK